MRWFNYRIIHRIIGTNKLLSQIGIRQSNSCTFCHEHEETIIHLFYKCRISKIFWEKITQWINSILEEEILFSDTDIIFGRIDKSYRPLNLIICLTKKHIYRQKMRNSVPNIIDVKNYIKYYIKLDFHSAKKNLNLDNFTKKWGPFSELITM